jgi:hypothetical protein
MCGMCPANGELENNDPESPVDFLCHVAHLRAAALGIVVPAHGECEYCPGGTRQPELQRSLAEFDQAREFIGSRRQPAVPSAGSTALPVLGRAGGVGPARDSGGARGSVVRRQQRSAGSGRSEA